MSTLVARTSNPALSPSVLYRARAEAPTQADTMSLSGTVVKTLTLVGILLATAAFTWSQVLTPTAAGTFAVAPTVLTYLMVGCVAGFGVALVTILVPRISPVTAPVYAALEGLALGALSAFAEQRYPGIVLESVGLTVGTLALLLVVYATGLARVTEGFKAGIIAATGAIALVYLVDLIMMLFGVRVPFIHETGPVGIGFSVFVVIVASLNLVLDFDLITQSIHQGAPRFMEWYCGFGLLVTLVWLYIEVVRLLMKIRER